jgi:hypothetical protein
LPLVLLCHGTPAGLNCALLLPPPWYGTPCVEVENDGRGLEPAPAQAVSVPAALSIKQAISRDFSIDLLLG